MSAAAPAWDDVLSYAQAQQTTGLLIVRDDQVVVEENWPAPADETDKVFRVFGVDAHGALMEDVGSLQKSLMSVLAGVAMDKGLLDVAAPISSYIGDGWSKASPAQEREIRVLNLLEMNTGLATDFSFEAPAGAKFAYNTPVYTVLVRVLERVCGHQREALTRLWLTGPAGMHDTNWRERDAALAAGNPVGMVTTPRDLAALGRIVLTKGLTTSGRRIISERQLAAIFARSPTNPGYGRMWWLNGAEQMIRLGGTREDGPLVPAAPPDLVAALGVLGRKLYVVPGLRLVAVRMGRRPPDAAFDQHFWRRLMKAIDG